MKRMLGFRLLNLYRPFASEMVLATGVKGSAGEHPMWVAKQMGHADWGMIRRTYGRWIPSEVDDAGKRAVEMFCPKSDE
ncbi:hypothetical protein [Chromobacterium sinusclupearum]|nr:hypothetical protein [Chromobacterium sinusclupearum]